MAEYRYNGLGHRIAVLADTDLDSDVDGSDLWYDSSSDERWRMVATYRSTDANPKERFVHDQAGASGDGGSSYIDFVALREKDTDEAWTDASDGDLEERIYYCQNQPADVVALVTNAGAQREMVRYSAYGVPIGLPVGDTNPDGDCDQADQNQVRDWALATPAVYGVREDLDLDGDVDLTDRDTPRDNYKDITLGRTKLSAVGNARGCAGYLAAGFDSTVYLIRNRVLPGELGVWASRDPLGYRDSFGVYEFCASRLPTANDSYGLAADSLQCKPERGVLDADGSFDVSGKASKEIKMLFHVATRSHWQLHAGPGRRTADQDSHQITGERCLSFLLVLGATLMGALAMTACTTVRDGPTPSSDSAREELLEAQVKEAERRARAESRGVDPSADDAGNTLLHRVARAGRVDLAARLLMIGSDINAENYFAYTPLDVVRQGGWDPGSPISVFLIKSGAKYHVFAE